MLPLDPEQLDALDMLGVIYARSGQGPRDRAMALVAPQRGGLRPSAHQPGDPLDGKQAVAAADSSLTRYLRRTFHGFLSKNYAVHRRSKKQGRRRRKLLMIRLADMAQLLLNC